MVRALRPERLQMAREADAQEILLPSAEVRQLRADRKEGPLLELRSEAR